MRRKELLQDNAEVARGDILGALAVLRQLGSKTVDGLNRIARHAGLVPRRTKTIVFRDVPYVVTDGQRRHLALSIADLHFVVADELERKAEECRRKGDAILHRERQQLSLAFTGGARWEAVTTPGLRSSLGPRKLCA